MRIRCPHCEQRVEVLDDDPLVEVDCPSCGSSFSLVGGSGERTEASPTRKIGHFELLNELGRGAFGTVWKAHDSQLDRYVAVKLPRKEQLSDDEAEQFIREARAAAQLKHPNLVSVHEVGRDDSGQLYIVSDFIQGASLAEWIRTKTPGINEAVELMIRLCEALQHAHGQGVVHRDLKPQNILMDAGGVPHITDFGLAKRDAGEITMTIEGKILGTPAYMSPEQAAGKSHTVDGRSDIYSLGVILFELLTGELPFRGSPQMLLTQILSDEPPNPRKLNDRIPRDLETICLKCLEKEPEKRYMSALEVGEDLTHYLADDPIRARPITPPSRAWRWYRRRVSTIAAAYTMFTFTVLGIMQIGLALLGTFLVSIPTAAPFLASVALVGFNILVAILGVKSGIWALHGLRRGMWISLGLFGVNSIVCLWGIYWSLGVTRDVTLEPLVRSSVLGYAVLCSAWFFTGLVLQVHALWQRQVSGPSKASH